ncbi:MAG: hypothetical protein CVV60_02145 [Tenericutes bacterium HGW-Tenericutes-5]|nr:MAG: hypothetical protein CVV60_02145 [Tenericutes bacterium HGW-Tenericutes-5]
MVKFFKKILNSEFLPVNEVRRLKVHVVMGFLFVITLITIPFSFFFNYSTLYQILSLAAFGLFYLLIFIFVRFKKIFTAIQVSIIYSLLLTVFYTRGISSFYAYIFFYITLTIIVFYQEIYSYFIYGTATLVLGIFYTLTYSEGLTIVNDVPGSMYVYIAGLVIYYLVSFAQIINNEKLYADMNLEWVRTNNFNSNNQDDLLNFIEDIRAGMNESHIFEDLEFQKCTMELSQFIAEQILKDGKQIVNLIDLYVYIHEKGLESILKNDEISVALKKNANILGKYLLNENTDMFSMIISFYLKFHHTDEYNINRYNYNVENITSLTDEQFIAFCLIYLYLKDELLEGDKWNTIKSEETDIEEVFAKIDLTEFFSDQLIAFYNDNIDLLRKHSKKH